MNHETKRQGAGAVNSLATHRPDRRKGGNYRLMIRYATRVTFAAVRMPKPSSPPQTASGHCRYSAAAIASAPNDETGFASAISAIRIARNCSGTISIDEETVTSFRPSASRCSGVHEPVSWPPRAETTLLHNRNRYRFVVQGSCVVSKRLSEVLSSSASTSRRR
jgi:hypothetical protein